ncbi:hypothetical protein IW492_09135 [Enterococcus sp. BWB1-3]|uniref:hypothetical protein n=1 Tax=Enterococcus sp. BWB1-3 TaxID=2787713 RepID=UPI001923100F|nr:hypothetical protein [Enterococcus sp. BWB1-3]MBL1229393.1 hypothetical protein [Enterococcus sp. BWB1-3]
MRRVTAGAKHFMRRVTAGAKHFMRRVTAGAKHFMRRVTAGAEVFWLKNQVGIIYSDKSIVVIYVNKAEYTKIVKKH